jgi:hypothetical protein
MFKRRFKAFKKNPWLFVKTRISSAIYDARCYFKPFNVVKCQELPRSWVDRDALMFHSMFQIIVDFVELEQPFKSWDDKFQVERYTDRAAMRAWIEYHFNTDEGFNESYPDWFDEHQLARAKEENHKAYLKNIEILYLYEWYKDKKYELDKWTLSEKTGMKLVIGDDGRVVRVANGKPTLITSAEYFEIIQEHDAVCDRMLERILMIRRYLWT